jgi:transcription elongation factor GreA
MYKFLRADLEALDARITDYEARLAEARRGIHETTTYSTETWHDNPAFDEQQQQSKMWDSERRRLRTIRDNVIVVEPAGDTGRVDIGSVVTIKDRRTGRQDSFTIASYLVIGSREDRLSYNSPLGRLLLGKPPGTIVTGRAGSRTVELEILDIAAGTG